jgi:hypothetical protein
MPRPYRYIRNIHPAKPKGFKIKLTCGHVILRERQVLPKKLCCPKCPKQWSRKYIYCKECKTNSRAYAGKGLCTRCHNRKHPPEWYSDYAQNRRYHLDDHLLDEWDERSAYFVGVVFAEGYLPKQHDRHGIQITLSIKDSAWLDDIKNILKFQGELYSSDKQKKTITLVFSSKKIYKKLLEIGFFEKDLSKIPDKIFHHFIRGFFDGDGSIFIEKKTGYVKTNFTGQQNLLKSIKDRLHELAGLSKNMQLNSKPNSLTSFSLCYGPRDTKKLCNFMYQEAHIFLERKHERSLILL